MSHSSQSFFPNQCSKRCYNCASLNRFDSFECRFRLARLSSSFTFDWSVICAVFTWSGRTRVFLRPMGIGHILYFILLIERFLVSVEWQRKQLSIDSLPNGMQSTCPNLFLAYHLLKSSFRFRSLHIQLAIQHYTRSVNLSVSARLFSSQINTRHTLVDLCISCLKTEPMDFIIDC